MVAASWVRSGVMSAVALAVTASSLSAASAQAGRDTRGSIRATATPLSAIITSGLTSGESERPASATIDPLIATDEAFVLWADQFSSVLRSPGNDQGLIEQILADLEFMEPLDTASPLYGLDPAATANETGSFSMAASPPATFPGLEGAVVAERVMAVPEPTVWIMMLLGVPALLRTAYRRRRPTR